MPKVEFKQQIKTIVYLDGNAIGSIKQKGEADYFFKPHQAAAVDHALAPLIDEDLDNLQVRIKCHFDEVKP